MVNKTKPEIVAPQFNLLWEAVVDVGAREDFGAGPAGHRYIVPILGGEFFAGSVDKGLCGQVLPGGADRQLVHSNGFKELDALYEMRTQDGTVLTIRNRVRIDETIQPERYARSVIEVKAPCGRFEWLNRRVIVGTMANARPAREAVIIRAWGNR